MDPHLRGDDLPAATPALRAWGTTARTSLDPRLRGDDLPAATPALRAWGTTARTSLDPRLRGDDLPAATPALRAWGTTARTSLDPRLRGDDLPAATPALRAWAGRSPGFDEDVLDAGRLHRGLDPLGVGGVADVDKAHAFHGVRGDALERGYHEIGGPGRVEAGVGQDVALHDAAGDVGLGLVEQP